MTDYRGSAHCAYDTKYRKAALTGQIAKQTREVVRSICKANAVEIRAEYVSKDYIHLPVD